MLLLTLNLVAVAGCGSGLADTLTSEFLDLSSPQTSDSDPSLFQLRLLDRSAGDEVDGRLQAAIDQFNRSAPEAAANLILAENYGDRLALELSGEAPPDLFYVDAQDFPLLASQGELAPWPIPVPPSVAYLPALLQPFSWQGTLYCLPHTVTPLALFYNRTLFEQAGEPLPQPNWGWAELAGAAQRLTDQDRDTVGMVLSGDITRWLPFLFQAGGSLVDPITGEMGVETVSGTAALDFYAGLIVDGWAQQPLEFGADWSGEALAKGRVALALEGSWAIPYFAQYYPDLNYGVLPLPAGPGGRGTLAFAGCYALSARSQFPAQAAQLAGFLMRPEILDIWTDAGQAVPAQTDLQLAWAARFPELSSFVDSVAESQIWQPPLGFDPVLKAANRDLQQVLDGSMLPEDMLNRLQTLGNQALK